MRVAESNIYQHLLDPLPTRSKDKVALLATDIGSGGKDIVSVLRKAHGKFAVISKIVFNMFIYIFML